MPSSVNPNEIAQYRLAFERLGAESMTLVTHQQGEPEEQCIVGWGTFAVVGRAPLGQIGGACDDAMRKLRAEVAARHPEVELPSD